MGACLSNATKVTGCSSSATGSGATDPPRQHKDRPPREGKSPSTQQDHHENQRQRERDQGRRTTGIIPCGKRTSFGYGRDFLSRYTIGKLLGRGQFGHTFVATDKANGDKVAVKRIDKNKVNQRFLLRLVLGNRQVPGNSSLYWNEFGLPL